MSKELEFQEYVLLKVDYSDPKPHKHFAYHLILSLGERMTWSIEQKTIQAKAVFIRSDVMHTGMMPQQGALVLTFYEFSSYAFLLDQLYLKGQPYALLDHEKYALVMEQIKCGDKDLGERLIQVLQLDKKVERSFDQRIVQVIDYLEQVESVEHDVISALCDIVCLSQSRLSHLFKEETGITLHQYMAFMKLKKTFVYCKQGMSFTKACVLAGFSSSSHFAATCKRMFGMSMQEFKRSFKNSI